tara:strand:- start:4919 stop:5500 length:582 start_codon:yes stop_codon:yes gene_type:complete
MGFGSSFGSGDTTTSAVSSSGPLNVVGAATLESTLNVSGNILQGPSKNHIYESVNIRFADSTDDTVIVQLSEKIPAGSALTRAAMVVKTVTNLGTHNVNLRLGTTSGRAADTDISSESIEVLGAGASSTRASKNTGGAVDVDLTGSKTVAINQDLAFMNADVYPYICNAGTGNGTTNSTAGTVLVYLEWIGLD